jgi:hypothetical protein
MRTRRGAMYERFMSENWRWQAVAAVAAVALLAVVLSRAGAASSTGDGDSTHDVDGSRRQLAEAHEDERDRQTEGVATEPAAGSIPDWLAPWTRGSALGSTGTVTGFRGVAGG